MPLERRTFLKIAGYSLFSTSLAAPQSAEAELLAGAGAMAMERTEVAAEIVQVMQKYGTHAHPGSGIYYYSGYGESLYTWESLFDSIALLHVGDTQLGKNNLRIFLDQQREDGFIPRHVEMVPPRGRSSVWHIYEAEEHAQPFLFQIALFLTRASNGDTSWITDDMYRKLKRYLSHWTVSWDRDSNGLCEWASAQHSGEDVQFDRAGVWRSYYCEGVDLNSFLFLEFLAAEKIARAKGIGEDSARFAEMAEKTKTLVLQLLWDEQDGFFYDRDIRTGERIKIKSVTGLYPLWAGIADRDQAKRLVQEHILNPKEFWSRFPLPSYAMNERNYTQHHVPPPLIDIYYALNEGHSNWRGGLWPHSNYFVAHGLQRYGFPDAARSIAERGYEISAPDRSFREWYNAETGEGLGGQSLYAGAEILLRFLPAELETGFDPGPIGDVRDPLDVGKLRKALALNGSFKIQSR